MQNPQTTNQEPKPINSVDEEFDRNSEPPMDYDTSGKGRFKMDGGGGIMKPVIISVIISVILSFALTFFSGQYVKFADYDTNTKNIVADIGQMKKDITSKQTEVNQSLQTIPTLISQAVNNSNTQITNQLNSINSQVNGYTQGIQDAKSNASAVSTKLDTYASATDKKIADLTAKEQADNTALQAKIDALTAKVNAIATPTPTPDGSNPTPTTGAGTITSTFFNSPMIFSKPVSTQARSFGIKLVNNYTDKDLVYVNITVKLTIANLTAFEDNSIPVLESTNGLFTWEYERGTGNTAIFTSDAYVYVAKNGGEFSDTQKLTLSGDSSLTGTYTVSVTSLTINSKTLQ